MSGQQIANSKYRNWVKAGLGLKYVKEGLEPFCDDIVKQQHTDIIHKVKQTHNLTTVNCGFCNLRTLQPDHVRTKNKQCPLGQKDCNCQYPGSKVSCPNNVCGAIYSEIINLHASTPPAPFWRNTDVQRWCTDPWAVAKCFINAPGYTQKLTVSQIDCCGLLHLLINSKDLQKHIHCKITGHDVFSKVRQHRNVIFHSDTMEVEDTDVTDYIDDMIAVLRDSKELNLRTDSQAAVQKLLQLKQHDFIITTSLAAEVKAAKLSIKKLQKDIEQKGFETEREIEQSGSNIKAEVEQSGSTVKAQIEQSGSNIKAEVEQSGSTIKAEVEQSGSTIKAQVEQSGSAIKAEVEQSGLAIKAEVEQSGSAIKAEIEKKCLDIKADVEKKGIANIRAIKRKGSDMTKDVKQTGCDIEKKVKKVADQKVTELKQAGLDVKTDLVQIGLDTRKEVEQTRSRIIKEIKETGADMQKEIKDCTESDQQRRYFERKKELQTHLMKMYNEQVTKISALPLLPDEDLTDIADVYVVPLLTVEKQNDRESKGFVTQSSAVDNQSREVYISVHDIFEKGGKPVKLSYVIGDAGSGKTTFCKYLVSNWCAAHSNKTCCTTDSDLVNEMRKFDFLFYISLRHYSDCHSIKRMLNEVYSSPMLDPIIDKLLQYESESCLIVLDGLDEWAPQRQKSSMFQTKGLPERDISKNYTIITTSRPWKFTSLRIKKSEVHQTINLKGLNDMSVTILTKQTVDILNKRFQKQKDENDFDSCIEKSPLSEICHVPLLLQQLICLWFDDNLKGTSKCAVYSSMLELFFEWAAQKYSECEVEEKNDSSDVMADLQLPAYLIECAACCDNKQVIQCLSHLAYETLFDKTKENSLIFTNSKLQQLKITDNVKSCSLRTGILSEDRGVTLLASRRQHSSFSFIHKSIQEYLAAVHIAFQFKNIDEAAAADQNYDVIKERVLRYFEACKSVCDILEYSNIFSMLCGLKPQLATCISEYICNIVAADNQVKEYRTTFNLDEYQRTNSDLVSSIQTCLISCTQEVISRGKPFQSRIHMGDIIIKDAYVFNVSDSYRYDDILLALENQVIVSDSVRSLYLIPAFGCEYFTQSSDCAIKYLTNCNQLQALRCEDSSTNVTYSVDFYEKVSEILVRNISTLEFVDMSSPKGPAVRTLLQGIPSMPQLTTLRIGEIGFCKFTHDECSSMSTLLTHHTRLQQISISIECEQYDKHVADLSNHKHLQYVDLQFGNFYVTKVNTERLVTGILQIDNEAEMKQLSDSLSKACTLKHLSLNLKAVSAAEDKTVYGIIVRLLPSLTSLSTVELKYVTFTDNIITRPSDLKNLQAINIIGVKMSTRTWYNFVDSLSELQQIIHVKALGMKMIADGKEMIGEDGIKKAQSYVREKTALFSVTRDFLRHFCFVTKI